MNDNALQQKASDFTICHECDLLMRLPNRPASSMLLNFGYAFTGGSDFFLARQFYADPANIDFRRRVQPYDDRCRAPNGRERNGPGCIIGSPLQRIGPSFSIVTARHGIGAGCNRQQHSVAAHAFSLLHLP